MILEKWLSIQIFQILKKSDFQIPIASAMKQKYFTT